MPRTGQIAQHLKVLAAQVWQSKFNPWNPHKGGRRESSPQSYPLTATSTLYAFEYKHTLAHRVNKFFKKTNCILQWSHKTLLKRVIFESPCFKEQINWNTSWYPASWFEALPLLFSMWQVVVRCHLRATGVTWPHVSHHLESQYDLALVVTGPQDSMKASSISLVLALALFCGLGLESWPPHARQILCHRVALSPVGVLCRYLVASRLMTFHWIKRVTGLSKLYCKRMHT